MPILARLHDCGHTTVVNAERARPPTGTGTLIETSRA